MCWSIVGWRKSIGKVLLFTYEGAVFLGYVDMGLSRHMHVFSFWINGNMEKDPVVFPGASSKSFFSFYFVGTESSFCKIYWFFLN